jgi:hypothetical protein
MLFLSALRGNMGSFRFPSLPSYPLEQALAEISGNAKTHMREGFSRIAAFDHRQVELLAREAVEHIDSILELDTDQLAVELGIDADEVDYAVSATSLTVALISSRKESADDITDKLVKVGLVENSAAANVANYVRIIGLRRADIKKAIDLRNLTDETLPAFRGFEASVDLRLGFKKDQIDAVVPVLLVHLRTDLDSARLFFQMNRSDVVRLADELKQLASRLDQAEKWANERPAKGD